MTRVRELLPLGANGFYPSFGRQTMSFLLILEDGGAILLDAGTGFSRLAEPAIRARLADLDRLDVVLSHYHLDHVCGLTYASTAWGRPLRVHAPGPPLVDVEPIEVLERLIGPPLFPLRLAEFPIPIEVTPYQRDFELSGMRFRTRRQNHPGGSVGLRIGDTIAYVTDTVADRETISLARGVDLLLHEVWASDSEAEAQPYLVKGHAAIGAVADIAERAGVGRLMPVHHHPKRSQSELDAFLDELEAASSVALVRPLEGAGVACR